MVILTDQEKARIIVDEVCKTLEVSKSDLYKVCRKRELVEARYTIFYFLKRKTRMSITAIALMFRQNHATALHGVGLINDMVQYNGYSKVVNPIDSKIEGRFMSNISSLEWVNSTATNITNYETA